MKLKVYSVKDESFRYGDENNTSIKRFATQELQEEYFNKQVESMRGTSDLTEYEPNCFEDSIHKWAYEFSKYEEVIEIIEKEEGEFLNKLIVESRKDKIEKISGNETKV